MKAERVEPKQKFVPVIVTLESQEEVDSLYVISNDTRMCRVLPALDGMYKQFYPFTSNGKNELWDRLNDAIR